jgi:RimJ/RimL family protein N-acetyltransferase
MREEETSMPSFWEGKVVRLRGVEPEDAEAHIGMNREVENERNLDQVYPPQSAARVRKWSGELALEGFRDGDNYAFQIESLETGELVGHIATHHCDPRVGVLSYGLSVNNPYRRKGYAADAICLVLRYYFQERRYQKANIGVFSFNDASQRLHERLGFTLEGRQRRTTFTRGEFADFLWYGITVEEFREKFPEYLEA